MDILKVVMLWVGKTFFQTSLKENYLLNFVNSCVSWTTKGKNKDVTSPWNLNILRKRQTWCKILGPYIGCGKRQKRSDKHRGLQSVKHGGKLSWSKFIQCGKGNLANRAGKLISCVVSNTMEIIWSQTSNVELLKLSKHPNSNVKLLRSINDELSR